MRAYYSATIGDFLNEDEDKILGRMVNNNQFSLIDLQRNAWQYEIIHLKKALREFDGKILFEYSIPRMGKRADVILLINNAIFVVEYKCGESEFSKTAIDQVYDYALDLKNFHKQSHDKMIIPILIATKTTSVDNPFIISKDKIAKPILSNSDNFSEMLKSFCVMLNETSFDYDEWENSIYAPTPTIIEAAQALYYGHNVVDISRSDSGAENLTKTTDNINKIIDKTKNSNQKAIIFVTGVPGAGKTLAGLNIVSSRQDLSLEEHAVFLSGNGPLVEVLQEALARDYDKNIGISGSRPLCPIKAFIQIIHEYRDACIKSDKAQHEKVVIFDEAQRAWDNEQIAKFMRQKKGIDDFKYSEPEFLISTMDRHKNWATIICLIGIDQEIHTGEAGLDEWFHSLKRSFPNWKIYISDRLEDNPLLQGLEVSIEPNLHLATSIRSFRSERISDLIGLILDNKKDEAQSLYEELSEVYPIFITRNLDAAKDWIKNKARGTERYGIIGSSGATRLRSEGIFVPSELDVAKWFLNNKSDIRSSYMLELVASEFKIQGLELDYAIVAWDANLRYTNGNWSYHKFKGTEWQNVNNPTRINYLRNSYRVLLTRARQGMVIFMPIGAESDHTRLPQYYDGIYNYLKGIGIKEI